MKNHVKIIKKFKDCWFVKISGLYKMVKNKQRKAIYYIKMTIKRWKWGVKYNRNDRYTVEKYFSQCKFGEKQGGTL